MTSGTTSRAERCVQVCGARAWRLAVALVWNVEDALDVVQQACLVAAAKPDVIPADDPWPWFARVVTLEAFKLRQKRASTSRLEAKGEQVVAMRGATQTVDAALEAERRELQMLIRDGLKRLPAEQRDAVTLTHIAGLTVRDAAEALGVSSSTVDRRVQAGLENLRRRLNAKGKERVLSGGLSAALSAMGVDHPPQGMKSALQEWLGTVRSHGDPDTTNIGGSSMKIALIAGVVVVLGCAGSALFLHLHHGDADPEQMQELHSMLWHWFHG